MDNGQLTMDNGGLATGHSRARRDKPGVFFSGLQTLDSRLRTSFYGA